MVSENEAFLKEQRVVDALVRENDVALVRENENVLTRDNDDRQNNAALMVNRTITQATRHQPAENSLKQSQTIGKQRLA